VYYVTLLCQLPSSFSWFFAAAVRWCLEVYVWRLVSSIIVLLPGDGYVWAPGYYASYGGGSIG